MRSLRAAFTWWFAATLIVLYGVVATAVWLYSRTSDQHYAILTLKAEGEAVAGYLAATGRLDAPEFTGRETAPFPIWFRLWQGAEILAETPGAPASAARHPGPTTDELRTAWSPSIKGPYVSVYHAVGGPLQGAILEVTAPTASVLRADRRLGMALALGGIIVIPLAALGGRLLAQRALRPVDGLVRRIRSLDSARLSDRLAVPPGTVEEVAILASAFDDLLDALERNVDTMRRFTADASHEIRNPLSVLRLGLEVALRRPRDVAEYRHVIHENLQEIERLQAVLEGLLTLAREVPGAPHPIVSAPVDLSELVARTADTFATAAAERRIRVDRDIEPDLEVRGDAHLLRLVAFNLLDNALKHSPPDATVRVALAGRDNAAHLRVADQGPGVAPENRERLFRRYSRAVRPGESGVGGLGLSVVAWVAERHGGRVQLLDTARGAEFEVTLPGLAPNARLAGDAEPPPVGASPTPTSR
jgi:signal transduction histidine kinase